MNGRKDKKILVLAPNHNIILDWEKRIEESLLEYKGQIEIHTFAYMIRNYQKYNNDY